MFRLLKAHDVRQLTQCPGCRSLGDQRRMITDPVGLAAGSYHPRCVLDQLGIEGVLQLSPADRGQFTIADLGVDHARLVLKSMDVPVGVGGVLV